MLAVVAELVKLSGDRNSRGNASVPSRSASDLRKGYLCISVEGSINSFDRRSKAVLAEVADREMGDL